MPSSTSNRTSKGLRLAESHRPLNQQASAIPKRPASRRASRRCDSLNRCICPRAGRPESAVPPKPDPEVSLQQESDRLSGAMQHNRLSDDQLNSRANLVPENAQGQTGRTTKIGEARIEYRRRGAATLQGATAQAEPIVVDVTDGHEPHAPGRAAASPAAEGHRIKTQKRKLNSKQTIDEIYERTAGCVKFTLETLTKKVTGDFTRSLKNETDTFNSRVRDRLDSYYSTGKKVKHFLLGEPKVVVNDDGSVRDLRKEDWDMSSFPPRIITPWINPQVYKIFLEEKDLFIAKMDVSSDAIAKDVQTGLTTRTTRSAEGLSRAISAPRRRAALRRNPSKTC